MFNLTTPSTQIDGASISEGAEKSARGFAIVIMILGIIMAVYCFFKGISDYSDVSKAISYAGYGHSNEISSKAFSELLMPKLIEGLLYLIISFFAAAALRVLSNISLALKAQTFANENETASYNE